ncbi:MAG: class I SAM-dependent methyltransferase [Chloroflexota bacterium]
MNPKRFLRKSFLAGLNKLPPDKTLRFLFSLDQWLYYLQGQVASSYGGGIHTKHRHMNYHQFFVRQIQPEERVIDIGCGLGAVAYTVAQESGASKVVGIDLSAKSIAMAQERHQHPKVDYRVGDALVDLPDEAFDLVILSNVLEHLPGRPEFLRRVQAALSPSRILIRVPLFERDWRVPLKKELGVEWRLDPTHEIEYTHETFAQEMDEANLDIIYQEIRWGEIWAVTQPSE